MCGASGQQKEAFANETKVSQLLTTQFQQFAGENQEILGQLTKNLSPIQEAGPSQFGLSPAQEAAERTGTAEQLTAAGSQVSNAIRGAIASKGGGTNPLPSGSLASIEGALAQDTAVKEALAQSKITERGYDIGRENWQFATKGLMEAPGALENPVTGAGGEALSGAQAQMKGADEITAANRAWEAPVGKLIGAGLTLIPGIGPVLGPGVAKAAGSLPGGGTNA
jgi:hypothetical protein